MTQRDIPVQPGETAVTAALRTLARIMGWCVTSTVRPHAGRSYHTTGRAVDLAARSEAGWDTPELLAVNEGIIQFVPLSMITELIYSGPGNICVRNGKIVNGTNYGPAVMARHHNHVHLAVIDTFVYNGGPDMPDDPNLPNLPDIAGFYPVINATTGQSNGYYILSSDGQLHAFGPGAVYFGRSEVPS